MDEIGDHVVLHDWSTSLRQLASAVRYALLISPTVVVHAPALLKVADVGPHKTRWDTTWDARYSDSDALTYRPSLSPLDMFWDSGSGAMSPVDFVPAATLHEEVTLGYHPDELVELRSNLPGYIAFPEGVEPAIVSRGLLRPDQLPDQEANAYDELCVYEYDGRLIVDPIVTADALVARHLVGAGDLIDPVATRYVRFLLYQQLSTEAFVSIVRQSMDPEAEWRRLALNLGTRYVASVLPLFDLYPRELADEWQATLADSLTAFRTRLKTLAAEVVHASLDAERTYSLVANTLNRDYDELLVRVHDASLWATTKELLPELVGYNGMATVLSAVAGRPAEETLVGIGGMAFASWIRIAWTTLQSSWKVAQHPLYWRYEMQRAIDIESPLL
jgi:hypothetical protein